MQGTDRIDPELIGHRLDLARPELRPILDRYVPRTALIVGPQSAAASLKEALIGDGWRVRACEGPGRIRCPLLEGKPCSLRESVDMAVVYIDGTATWPSSGLLARLRCAADPASPSVVALEGRLDSPRTEKRHGVVGALRSSVTIVKAVAAVADRDPRTSEGNGAR